MKRLLTELLFVTFLFGYFLLMIYTKLNVSVMITIPVLLLVPLLGKEITKTYYNDGKIESKLLYPYILFSFFVVATNGMSLVYTNYNGVSNYEGLPIRSITMLLPMIILLLTSLLYFILSTRKFPVHVRTKVVTWTNRVSTIIYVLSFLLYIMLLY